MLGNVKILENEDAQATVIATIGIAAVTVLYRFYCDTVQYFFWLPVFLIYGIPTYYYKDAITNNYDGIFILVIFFCSSYLIHCISAYLGKRYKKITETYIKRSIQVCVACLVVFLGGGSAYYLPEYMGHNELFREFRQLMKNMSDSIMGTTFEDRLMVIMAIILMIECAGIVGRSVFDFFDDNMIKLLSRIPLLKSKKRILIYLVSAYLISVLASLITGTISYLNTSYNIDYNIVRIDGRENIVLFESKDNYYCGVLIGKNGSDINQDIKELEDEPVFVDTNQYYWINKTRIRVRKINRMQKIEPSESIFGSPSETEMMNLERLLMIIDGMLFTVLTILLNIVFWDMKQTIRKLFVKPLLLQK